MENTISIITMAGGLAFFLYGMTILGNGLEKLSGGRMERTLEKLTNNIFKSLLLGMVVTAAIQSSSATTVIVVGLVNAGILKLKNAVGVIMGANIGTTATSIILSFTDAGTAQSASAFMDFLKPTTIAPVVAVIAIIILLSAKRQKPRMFAEIMLGFAILFNGMFIMTDAVAPLSNSPVFKTLFTSLSNPFLGILSGTVVTAVLQSSSASVGILQAVASSGIITYSAAVPIIMGQNIGTCVTSFIASFGANRNAKRAAMVHLYFNLIGTIVLVAAVYITNSFIDIPLWDDAITMSGIAGVHIAFNILTTIILLPFAGGLEKLAIFTVRKKKGEKDNVDIEVVTLDERFLRSPAMAINQTETVVANMGKYAEINFAKAIKLFTKFDKKAVESIMEYENAIDRMEDKASNYLIQLTAEEKSDADNRAITKLLKILSEFERIGDYTINIVELAQQLYEKQVSISEKALKELDAISEAVKEIINMSIAAFEATDVDIAVKIEPLEETIDIMEDTLKFKHIERLKNGKCTVDGGLIFLELLANLERISDHCSNVGVFIIGFANDNDSLNRHEYLKYIHSDEVNEEYKKNAEIYHNKYFTRI